MKRLIIVLLLFPFLVQGQKNNCDNFEKYVAKAEEALMEAGAPDWKVAIKYYNKATKDCYKKIRLDLKGKDLLLLPEGIGNIHNLREIDLEGNRVTELPKSIGLLEKAHVFKMADNQIKSLPTEIKGLKSLYYFDLTGNQLTVLPPEIGEVNILKKLLLSANQLTEIPEEIGQLHRLTLLKLDNNQLSDLPESMGLLRNLYNLSLRNNNLTQIPDTIARLPFLGMLDLRGNPLSKSEVDKIKALKPDCRIWSDFDEKEEDDSSVLMLIEEQARFPGCENEHTSVSDKKDCSFREMYAFIEENLKYPEAAKEKKIEGTVVLEFEINKADGKLRNIRVVHDIGDGCGEAALNVFGLMNEMNIQWIPAKQRGRSVTSILTIPVRFTLGE